MTAAARAFELTVDRCTEGLDETGQQELDALLADGRWLSALDAEELELAAAAIELACTIVAEPLPAALRQRVSMQAKRFFAAAAPPQAD